MNIVLSPRLVLVEGRGGAGRTTLSRELARRIVNAFVLTRDQVLYGGQLFLRHADTPNLPPIEEYIGRAVLPENRKVIETPFGTMTRVDHTPPNDFHERHTKKQSYLILGRLAHDGLLTGKVPIIDGFLPQHIADGSLKKFLDQPEYAGFPKYLVHVVVDEKECFSRWQKRAEADPEAAIRGKFWAQNRKAFHELMEKHAIRPTGLEELPHLFLDTTGRTIEDGVYECLAYIQNGSSEQEKAH